MRKITLSAALLAMTMMGCSDMGIDNSVASTNDVKQEKSSNFLAKSIYYDISSVSNTLQNMQPTNNNGNGYQFYAYPEAGIGIQFQTRDDLDWDGWEGQGEFNIAQAPFNPNTVLVATGLFSDCAFYNNFNTANCRGFDSVAVEYRVNENISNILVRSPRNPRGQKLSKHKFYMELGAVAAFVAVWNQATPYQLVTNGATYNGGMFEENGDQKARAIYKTYIWPKLREKLF